MEVAMPVAHPPPGTSLPPYYAQFSGKISAVFTPGAALSIWLGAESAISPVYAPLKSAMSFVPLGSTLDGAPASVDTLRLATWPATYVEIKTLISSAPPSEIRFGNIDPSAVRTAAASHFALLGRPPAAVDAFMAGEGLLRVAAGTQVGAAATGSGPPSATTPNLILLDTQGPAGEALNPLQFLADLAGLAAIDATQHPLLSQLPLDGWIEIVVVDQLGRPLPGEPYVIYLADDTQRTGLTDSEGRLFESGLPPGAWAIDMPNSPSVELQAE